jgi:hypothetical protein
MMGRTGVQCLRSASTFRAMVSRYPGERVEYSLCSMLVGSTVL